MGNGFKFGYVVYERPSSVHNAMNKMDSKKVRYVRRRTEEEEGKAKTKKKREELIGLEKWREEYNRSIVDDLEGFMKEIEAGVAKIDRKKSDEVAVVEAEAEAAAAEGEEDEEGWTVVSRHTTKKPVGKATDKAQARVKAREAR